MLKLPNYARYHFLVMWGVLVLKMMVLHRVFFTIAKSFLVEGGND